MRSNSGISNALTGVGTKPNRRYGAFAQALHWITALLVLFAFIYGPGGSEQRVYEASVDFDRQLHETLGLCVFVLTVLRVLWWTINRRPPPPQLPRSMEIASRATQWGLYLLLFALPLTGILSAWLEGHPLTLLLGAQVGPLFSPSHDLGVRIASLHGWLGDAILWLAGLHALAALYHHFIRKDDVLASMLPRSLKLRGLGRPPH